MRDYANNCLFDAVIKSADLKGKSALDLRIEAEGVLTSEGFPLIPRGEPAGEQYIGALSKITERPIFVKKDNARFEVRHESVPEAAGNAPIVIEHLGNAMGGHWEGIR